MSYRKRHLSGSLSIPAGLNKEQRDLFEAAGNLPLLLVKNADGKVTSIHIIDR